MCSNIGGAAINDVALDFWHSGQNREDIGMEDLEHRLRAETMEAQGMSFWHFLLYKGHFVIHIQCRLASVNSVS